jgi:hypothetical protein
MFKGKDTYVDFLAGGEKIATNILADRLSLLESGGIITKHKHPDSKAKILLQAHRKRYRPGTRTRGNNSMERAILYSASDGNRICGAATKKQERRNAGCE